MSRIVVFDQTMRLWVAFDQKEEFSTVDAEYHPRNDDHARTFQEKTVPADTRLVGWAALVQTFGVQAPVRRPSTVSEQHVKASRREERGWNVFDKRYCCLLYTSGIVTSNTATGSANAADDSLTSLGGLVLLVNLLLGEVIFGGLGTGVFSMIMTAAIAVFLAGLMIGRTPEYLGKQIGPNENKMIVFYALTGPVTILILTAIAISTKAGLAGRCV